MLGRAACVLFVMAMAPLGCGGNEAAPGGGGDASVDAIARACVPGASAACTGAGGCSGGQVCSDDGTRFGACMCAVPDASSSADAPLPPPPPPPMSDASASDASDAPVDATSTDAACVTSTTPLPRQPVYMLFILDGSGSMKDSNKWSGATAALTSTFQDLQAKADPAFGAGLIVFQDTKDTTSGGPYPESIDVPIAFVDSTQESLLAARIDGQPAGSTPTGAALTGAYGEVEAFSGAGVLGAGGTKAVVLITDGVPTDGSNGACVTYAGNALAAAAPGGPVRTFVIGVGGFPSADLQVFDPTFVGNVAKAGGTAPAGCNPNDNSTLADVCYYEVDPTSANLAQLTQAFSTAIQSIRAQAQSCTFAIPAPDAGAFDPSRANVVFLTSGGQEDVFVEDASNGWTFDSMSAPTSISLHGPACATVQADPTGKVEMLLGCLTMK